jgi:hypothetical protein
VFSSLGKGMFANVVRARVIHGEVGEAGKEVAIKIIRCQESMYVHSMYPPFVVSDVDSSFFQVSIRTERGADFEQVETGRPGRQEAHCTIRTDL